MIKKYLFLVALIWNFSDSYKAAVPEIAESDMRRINALIEGAQGVLARAAERGGEENVMIVGGEAPQHAPALLNILQLFGIADTHLNRFHLREGDNSAVTWFSYLVEQGVFRRGVFAVDKITNGLSKADNIVAAGGINPKTFLTNVYNLVRFLYERDCDNPRKRDAVKTLAFGYFDKLNEQNTQCCRGAIGRTFHVLILSCSYLFDQHNADVRRREEERARATLCGSAADAAATGAVAQETDGQTLAAAREMLEEKSRLKDALERELIEYHTELIVRYFPYGINDLYCLSGATGDHAEISRRLEAAAQAEAAAGTIAADYTHASLDVRSLSTASADRAAVLPILARALLEPLPDHALIRHARSQFPSQLSAHTFAALYRILKTSRAIDVQILQLVSEIDPATLIPRVINAASMTEIFLLAKNSATAMLRGGCRSLALLDAAYNLDSRLETPKNSYLVFPVLRCMLSQTVTDGSLNFDARLLMYATDFPELAPTIRALVLANPTILRDHAVLDMVRLHFNGDTEVQRLLASQ